MQENRIKMVNLAFLLKQMRVLRQMEVCTHSYFLIGCYKNERETQNAIKYLRTKFVLFIVMTTLSVVNRFKLVFYVSIQEFTENSDIDWTKFIQEIDTQLYTKYGLTEQEVDFIEEK